MEFVVLQAINPPDYVTLPIILKVGEWKNEYVVTLEDKGIAFIRCKLLVNGEAVNEDMLFFLNNAAPLAPIMEEDVKVGIFGLLSFHKSLLPSLSNETAGIEFVKNESPQEQPPVTPTAPAQVDHEQDIDPIFSLFADLPKYAAGGFKTFQEFRKRLENIKHIDLEQYAPLVEEAAESMFRTLPSDQKKFASLLIKEIKEIMR